jgi:hypothetical protein
MFDRKFFSRLVVLVGLIWFGRYSIGLYEGNFWLYIVLFLVVVFAADAILDWGEDV